MDRINISEIQLNQLEYCILEETIILPVTSVRVSVPKLTMNTNSSKTYANSAILINDSACKPKKMSAIELSTGIQIKVFSNLISSNSVKIIYQKELK